ncbi:MAG TPA: metal-dependent transcriptional regulator, partial [Proteobacteria bacterium]|nr:metal-dependent transcriptional regulator [Pseudomonadota bacterium]
MSKESLTPTMEDYLEAIFNLEKEVKAVRVKDIAGRMGVKLPTVTGMLSTLLGRGLIKHEKYEYVELTRDGLELGREVNRRHEILRRFFTDILNIDASQADADACKMEHAISPVSLEALIRFMEFIENCPRGGAGWLEYFSEYCRHGRSNDKCLEHMKKFMKNYGAKLKSIEE